jgi:hypothetical protein
MDRLTKILVTVFGAFAVYALVDVIVYPRWIKPLLTIEQRMADKQDEYGKLLAVEDEVRRGKDDYKGLVSRIGSFDIAKVETAIRDRLNRLIEKHQLQDANVSPSRPTKDRKTNIENMLITVTAVGNLESVVGLLKDVAELPQLVRVSNPAIYPATSGRRERGLTLMNVRVPIEVLVLPQHKLAGTIDAQELAPPELFVRHEERDYSIIWEHKPFTEPVPLRLTMSRGVSVEQGQQASLSVTVTGGDNDYRYDWNPKMRLTDPTAANTTVDTSEPLSETYTVTVSDGSGESVSESVQVTVREPRKRPAEGPKAAEVPPPPPPPADKRLKNREQMQLCSVLQTIMGAERSNELMVHNSRSRETTYYALGNEFDGGELVFVHPRGGVVRRNGQYFIYPIGSRLDGDVSADAASAADHPELMEAIERIREAEKAAAEAAQAAAGTPPPMGVGDGNVTAQPEAAAEGNVPAAEDAAAGMQVDVTGHAPDQTGGQVPPTPESGTVEVPQTTEGDTAVAEEQDSEKEKPKRTREPRPGTKRGTTRPPRERKGKD